MTKNNTLSHKKRLLTATLASLCLATGVTHAALLVDWGGDYVSSNQQLQAGGFSGNDTLSIAPTSGYTGSALFGKIEADSGITESVLEDNGSNDEINIGAANGENVYSLVLWKPGTFTVAPTDQITINRVISGSGLSTRIALQDTAGTYYISSSSGTNFSGTPFNLASINFFNWDPVGADSAQMPASYVGAGLDFTTTEFVAAGLVFSIPSGVTAKSASIIEFALNGTSVAAVPEPSTYTLLLGLSSLALIAYRRKQN